MINFKCERCGHPMRAEDASAGREGKCRACYSKVVVPSLVADVPPVEPEVISEAVEPNIEGNQPTAIHKPPCPTVVIVLYGLSIVLTTLAALTVFVAFLFAISPVARQIDELFIVVAASVFGSLCLGAIMYVLAYCAEVLHRLDPGTVVHTVATAKTKADLIREIQSERPGAADLSD